MWVALYTWIATSFWIELCLYLLWQRRKIPLVRNAPDSDLVLPRVDIIIACRNEAPHLAEVLERLCRLDYPDYRIILVNDRSDDGSGAIAEAVATRYSRLTVLHLDTLPPNWLGKNHALQQGYLASEAPYLLFTDADVLYEPDSLRRVMTHLLARKLDHVTVLPGIHSRSPMLNAIMPSFFSVLEMQHRPWSTGKRRPEVALGLGAFNLVNRKKYEDAGMHQAISVAPNDDLKLATGIRRAGGRQALMYGIGALHQEWYADVPSFIHGLEKNSFASFGYNGWRMLLTGLLPTLLLIVLPVPVLLLSGWPIAILAAGIILLSQTILMLAYPAFKPAWWYGLAIPLAGMVMMYIMLRSAWLTLRQRGIYWRDQFYPLWMLREE